MYPKVIFLILFPLFAFSQSPQKINFQSILRNTNGEVVSEKTVSLKISILSGSTSGSSVYGETHTKTTDASGLISLQIGSGTVLSGVFANIGWGDAPHFIKLEADFNGGNNFVLLGTQELMSVPYAFHSNTADSLGGGINLEDIKDELGNLRRQMDTLLLAPVFDIDGNQYGVVKIGNVLWLNQNLKVSRYNNGDSIGYGNNGWKWYNDDSTNDLLYGKHYSFNAVKSRKLCPKGWKIPNDYSPHITRHYWFSFDYLDSYDKPWTREVAGLRLKLPQFGGTNEYGWNGALGGIIHSDGQSYYINTNGTFWQYNEDYFENGNLDGNSSGFSGGIPRGPVFNIDSSNRWAITIGGYNALMSVRCVKDY